MGTHRTTGSLFSRINDGQQHPVVTRNINVVLADLQSGGPARTEALQGVPEYGIDALLPVGQWLECALSGCTYGCKVYRDRNGKGTRLAISHHNGYGCDVTQADIDQQLRAEEPLAEWERVLLGEIIRTDLGHGEERAVSAWEQRFLTPPTPHQREWAALSL